MLPATTAGRWLAGRPALVPLPPRARCGTWAARPGRGPLLPARKPLPKFDPRPAIGYVEAPADEASTEDGVASEDETFQWTKNWYPIIPLDLLEESQGEGFESGLPQIQRQAILGRNIVLWKDAEGKWRAVEDRCSHRLAALSLGSVQEDGTLACRYHGWCFNGKGECTRIPQAVDAASEATACASSRSRVQAFPTTEAHGLLWVWPDDSPSAWEDASSAEPASGRVQGPEAKWGVVDVPVSYVTSVENVVDPSHANFAHEGQSFFGSKFSPRHNRTIDVFKALQRPSQKGGIHIQYTAPSKDDNGSIQETLFRPPTLTTIQLQPSGMPSDTSFELHWVPCRPGLTRTLFGISSKPLKTSTEEKASFSQKVVLAMKTFSLIFGLIQMKIVPKFLRHINEQNYISRQDMVTLHTEDLELFRSNRPWQQQFYLPTLSDVGVVNFRQWLTRFGGGGPKWYGGQSEKEAIENIKYSDLFNRWEQHSKYCATCRKTLKTLGFLESALPKVAICLLGVSAALAAFRTAEPRMAVMALVAAVLAMLGQYWAQKIRSRLITHVPSTGIPEFSLNWGS
ncbi:unnamed protein product [Ostreobium quekettii]|uniref:Rieske domain-containing protein n=1 Tax=Ostreobium quekettii TaxID=121088 RepID=A0A8S1J937_9CHLO|nr:unnamed protein product [Ostreobium quekettii]